MNNKLLLACLSLLLITSSPIRAETTYWLPATATLKVEEVKMQLNPGPPGAWSERWTKRSAVDTWNEEAISLVVKYNANPLRASRVLTLMHVAMHDVYFRAKDIGLGTAGRQSAMHTAASAMLDYSFPLESPGRIEAFGTFGFSAIAANQPEHTKEIQLGHELGKMLTKALILYVMNDGMDEYWDPRDRPATKPGIWEPAPPLDTAHPVEPMAGKWRTWIVRDGAEFQPPPALDMAGLKEAAREVLEVNRHLTDEQKRIAEYWHLDQGTVTPGGVWNQKTLELANRRNLEEEEKVRLMAALNVGIYDAFITCWQAKYTWWVPRPIIVIREHFDKKFEPYLLTPPHPSYVSGHSTISGTSAEVVTYFLPADAKEIEGWAHEAAMSRLYGGIHYHYDDEEGLALGHKVGKKVVAHLAKPSEKNQMQEAKE